MTLKCDKPIVKGDTVEINLTVPRDMERWRFNEPLRNCTVLQTLRNAGVPVIGAISILGVEHGTLTMQVAEDDIDGDMFRYTWTGKAAHLVKPAPRSTSEFQNLAAQPEDDDL